MASIPGYAWLLRNVRAVVDDHRLGPPSPSGMSEPDPDVLARARHDFGDMIAPTALLEGSLGTVSKQHTPTASTDL